MKTVGADTKVVSRHGDIITYEQHCQRLVAFAEEVKEKALQLTQRNTELSEYIRSLKPVFGKELYIENTTCYHFVTLQSPYLEIALPEMSLTQSEMSRKFGSSGLNEDGLPILYYSFLSILNSFVTIQVS